MASRRNLDWARDGTDWPNREYSRFVRAERLEWHVQVVGSGPVLLLLHGTGGSSHTWGDMLMDLADDFTVVTLDLPGHAFTASPTLYGLSLPGMVDGLSALLDALELSPVLGVGHSAGAAILARMALDGIGDFQALVSINGAFVPFAGLAGRVFSPLAKLMTLTPFTARLFASQHDDPVVIGRLLKGTGSQLEPRNRDLYRRLVASPRHVSGALGMMANWDLRALERDLPRLSVPLTLVTCAHDRTVPPHQAQALVKRIPNARLEALSWGGHLGHEERPPDFVALIRDAAERVGLAHPDR